MLEQGGLVMGLHEQTIANLNSSEWSLRYRKKKHLHDSIISLDVKSEEQAVMSSTNTQLSERTGLK
jgi:hypothetical protein